jgi:hypothetical protein
MCVIRTQNHQTSLWLIRYFSAGPRTRVDLHEVATLAYDLRLSNTADDFLAYRVSLILLRTVLGEASDAGLK